MSRDLLKIEPWFEGKRVVIIAGGESVTLKQIHLIARHRLEMNGDIRVIAVNDAIYPAWWADWLHCCDAKWWYRHIQQVWNFKGTKTTLDNTVPAMWAGLLLDTGKTGFDENPSNCRNGGNGAYQAIHCAIHAGAREIVLVGVDMNSKGHWFGGHPDNVECDRETVMLPSFKTIDDELKRREIKTVNASPMSKLDIWPKVDLENALNG